jgi:hypothetical protein
MDKLSMQELNQLDLKTAMQFIGVDYILLQWMDYNHNEMYCNRDSNHEI